MSGFQIKLDGLRLTVLADLPKQVARPANSDQSFMKPLTDFIAAEIGKLDAKYNGVLVISGGSFDKSAGRIEGSFQIIGKQL